MVLAVLGWVLCGFFHIAAWVMAASDLREMRAGRMDPSGMGLTQAGMIMGIVGTVMMGLGGMCFAFALVADAGGF